MRISVCNGDKCKNKGAKKVRARLKDLVKERGLEDSVELKKTDCCGKCGDGPVVKIRPGKGYETKVKAKDTEKILEEALKKGE